MKVCHITSVHDSLDDRIFLKECVSLAKAGYDTYLVAYGESNTVSDVKIVGIGEREDSRINRVLRGAKRIYEEAVRVDADIYQFHDPELLPYGIKLKKLGKRVIYDSHEDVPRQIMAKDWIPKPFRMIISVLFEKYEKTSAKKLDCVITATPHIAKEFEKAGAHTEVVKNYPILQDIHGKNEDYSARENIVCYAGGLTEQRGITDIIKAVGRCHAKLLLAGDIESGYKEELSALDGYSNAEFLGFLNREQVESMYNRSRVGLCVLRNTPNHVNALAIKLFEYMAAGIPIVCSNFPLWIDIVEKNGCGICVEPGNPEKIKEAIQYLLNNQEEAKKMGDAGKEVVKEKYNWENEKMILLQVYSRMCERRKK